MNCEYCCDDAGWCTWCGAEMEPVRGSRAGGSSVCEHRCAIVDDDEEKTFDAITLARTDHQGLRPELAEGESLP